MTENGAVVRVRDFDSKVAHSARRYNYWLGGKDHFAADRGSGDAIEAVFPAVREAVRENRLFLGRVVRYLAGEVGIRQFLDIGAGIPAPGNTHVVAQAVDPTCRVVYVDNDPVVVSHCRALSRCTPDGVVGCLQADLRDPGIVSDPVVTGTLDLDRPVGVFLLAVLQYVAPDVVYSVVRRLVDGLPAGSWVAISHPSLDTLPRATAAALTAVTAREALWFRARAEVARLAAGLTLAEPVQPISQWHPDQPITPDGPGDQIGLYGLLARLP